jgi:hypothetical protein
MSSSAHPFRNELAVATERTERLARENATLRARYATLRLDRVQWSLVGFIASCGVVITYALSSLY